MSALSELDALLLTEEEEYFKDDLFLEVEHFIEMLEPKDVFTLIQLWPERDSSWRERFSHSSAHIKQGVLEPLLEAALETHTEPSTVLGLMTFLPKVAGHSVLTESLVDYATDLWHSSPEIHTQIEVCSWSCGLSNRLLQRLGFNSWQEARQ